MTRIVAAPSRAAATPRAARRPLRRTLNTVLIYAVLIGIFIFAAFPLIWTFIISITDSNSVTTGHTVYDFPASLFPARITVANFFNVVRTYPAIEHAFFNSVIISGLSIVLTVIVSALAAYPLARNEFWGKAVIFGVIVATMVLPTETSFLVNMLSLAHLRQIPVIGPLLGIGSYLGVVLPTVSTAFGIFLMRQAFLSIPQSLLEAARIDGAREGQIFRGIMLPLSMPSMAALSIFTLVNTWNSYFWPSIALTGSQDKFPLAVEMLKLKGAFNDNIFNTAAGAMIMMIPILLLFLFAQRFFMRGLEGATK
ncbi:carbohydrate ABC transporter permease [Deinococcus ruber]|uniref:Sugar ABC transporter permease n=1 Tax=Deinococcus ruber TaxID=1848197 RepID=A0A918CIF7_9DEIO|nr:carbohydrate ABC transporter permease [Deinococcus ruber]GGR25573.1 sugar ABC transporter permease [Deinococcus ruber]